MMVEILRSIGIPEPMMYWFLPVTSLVVMAVIAVVAYCICHKVLAVGVRRVVSQTKASWDDELFNDRLLAAVSHLLPPIALTVVAPWFLETYPDLLYPIEKALSVYTVMMSVHLVNVFLTSLYGIYQHKEELKSHPLKGLLQTLKLITICIGVIIIISLLINKNPVIILSGLGASAAILMLVFKDTIMGLVSGIQLSANDMVRPGDWIAAPKYGVNGTVKEITLTTVKVQNWDMTIVTVPPYSLISDSFQNWRGMQESGGRRVKRSLNFDMNTVRFCTEEEIKKLKASGWIEECEAATDGRYVNLHLFRQYVVRYLSKHPGVNQGMLSMVRQLQPTPEGLPVELYFFTATTAWVKYESIQAEVFDHLLAVVHEFGLKVFQTPAGTDLHNLKS
ncbi:MAG: mechanosensitive ion channel [Muribaculaceae bacterium]|nr:mechanosensitive ion channel [Muribaculaceae bacterium]